jgi:5'-nucleotidase
MAYSLENTLVIGISATALFDLSEADKLYKDAFKKNPDTAIDIYREFMLKTEDIILEHGIAYPLIHALLHLNQYQKKGESPLVEVVIMSRNSPDTGVRVLNTIRKTQLNITRSAFTAGESSADYLDAFDVDLFLTTNEEDAQKVTDEKICACAVLSTPTTYKPNLDPTQVRIAFDGDAVLFNGFFFFEQLGKLLVGIDKELRSFLIIPYFPELEFGSALQEFAHTVDIFCTG